MARHNLLHAGERLGDWEIDGKLGFGTFSEIYAAHHVVSRTRAALKVDKPGSKHESLQHEADILRSLQRYPLVARFYGVL